MNEDITEIKSTAFYDIFCSQFLALYYNCFPCKTQPKSPQLVISCQFYRLHVSGCVYKGSHKRTTYRSSVITSDFSCLGVLSSAVDKTKTASPLSHKLVDIVTRLIRWPTDICYPGQLTIVVDF